MNEKLDKLLCKRYPLIFAGRHADVHESGMAWGFSCGDGWFGLLDMLCSSLQAYVSATPGVPQVVASQVKEKFGGLRFYYVGGDTVVDKLVSFAEDLSHETCEECGTNQNVGTTTTQWAKTVCKVCWEKSERLREREWESLKARDAE